MSSVNMADSRALSTRWNPACVLTGGNSSARILRRKEPGRVPSTRQTATGVADADAAASAAASLFLCCYAAACIPVVLADSCFPSGPESCSFEAGRKARPNVTGETSCSWVNTNFRYLKNDAHVYLQLDPGRREGRLTSRTGCRDTTPGCLKFLYFFDVNHTIDLSVAVRYDGDDDVTAAARPEAPEVWTASTSGFSGWSVAAVPITTGAGDFRVIFKAERRPAVPGRPRPAVTQAGSVFLDQVQYARSQSSRCTLGPLVAGTTTTPPPARTMPTSSTTTTTTGSGLAVGIAVAVVVLVVASVIVAVVTRVVVRSVLRRVRAGGEADGSEELASLQSQHC